MDSSNSTYPCSAALLWVWVCKFYSEAENNCISMHKGGEKLDYPREDNLGRMRRGEDTVRDVSKLATW